MQNQDQSFGKGAVPTADVPAGSGQPGQVPVAAHPSTQGYAPVQPVLNPAAEQQPLVPANPPTSHPPRTVAPHAGMPMTAPPQTMQQSVPAAQHPQAAIPAQPASQQQTAHQPTQTMLPQAAVQPPLAPQPQPLAPQHHQPAPQVATPIQPVHQPQQFVQPQPVQNPQASVAPQMLQQPQPATPAPQPAPIVMMQAIPGLEPASDSDEGRDAPRRRALKSGVVSYSQGNISFPCVVKDISASGARLKTASDQQVPDTFQLLIELDGLAADCEVVWRGDRQVGVRFIGQPQIGTPTRAQVLYPSEGQQAGVFIRRPGTGRS